MNGPRPVGVSEVHVLAITLAALVAACPPDTEAAIREVEGKVTTLHGQVEGLRNGRERERVKASVTALHAAVEELRGAVGCTTTAAAANAPAPALVTAAPSAVPLDEAERRALLGTLRGERFDDVRLDLLDAGLSGRCVDTPSAVELLRAFSSEDARLEAWRRLAPRLAQRTDGATVVGKAFTPARARAAREALARPAVAGCGGDVDEEAARP